MKNEQTSGLKCRIEHYIIKLNYNHNSENKKVFIRKKKLLKY